MKTKYFIAGALTLIVMIFAAGASFTNARPTQWEYGRLDWVRSAEFSTDNYRWSDSYKREFMFPDNMLTGEQFKKFLRISDEFSVTDVLNHIGKEGWELVLVDTYEKNEATSSMYHFKRPKQSDY